MFKKIIAISATLALFAGSANAITMFKEPPFEAYKVSKGDSFWFIAKRYGLDYKKLMELNPGVDPLNMQVGSVIRLKPEANEMASIEKQVINLVNQERYKAGLSPFKENQELSRVAEFKSQDMADRGYFSHNSPTYGDPFRMISNFGIDYSTAGENIAAWQKTAAEVVEVWMNSDGHRMNILSKQYTEIGVGYVEGGKYGHYWVQMFIGE